MILGMATTIFFSLFRNKLQVFSYLAGILIGCVCISFIGEIKFAVFCLLICLLFTACLYLTAHITRRRIKSLNLNLVEYENRKWVAIYCGPADPPLRLYSSDLANMQRFLDAKITASAFYIQVGYSRVSSIKLLPNDILASEILFGSDIGRCYMLVKNMDGSHE